MSRRTAIALGAILCLMLAQLYTSPTRAFGAPRGRLGAPRLVYQANWKHGKLGWSSSGDGSWQVVNGALLFDGAGASAILAPPTFTRRWNYAVEATIQTTGHSDYNGTSGFGIAFRAKRGLDLYPHYGAPDALGAGVLNASAGIAPIWVYPEPLDRSDFDPHGGWHTYRVEVRGNDIRLLVDGQLAARAKSNRFLGGPRMGIFSIDSEIAVRDFKVYGLSAYHHD